MKSDLQNFICVCACVCTQVGAARLRPSSLCCPRCLGGEPVGRQDVLLCDWLITSEMHPGSRSLSVCFNFRVTSATSWGTEPNRRRRRRMKKPSSCCIRPITFLLYDVVVATPDRTNQVPLCHPDSLIHQSDSFTCGVFRDT